MKTVDKTKFMILISLLLISIFIVVLAIKISSKKEGNNNNKEYVINTEIEEIKNDSYYLLDYILRNNEESASFLINEVYVNKDEKVKYYFIDTDKFVKGFNVSNYYNNLQYLIIIKNGYYKIINLGDSNDIKKTSYNYEIKDIDTNSLTKIGNYDYRDDTIKLTYYLETFKDYLRYNPEKSYTMISDKLKEKYSTYNSYYNDLENIYNNINSFVSAYRIENENGLKKYIVRDNNNKIVEIIEEYPMHFRINF